MKTEQPSIEFCKVEILEDTEEIEQKLCKVEEDNVFVPKAPNSCPYCSRVCKPSHLKIHIRVHTGERPHKCDECQKAFKQQSYLTQHKLKVHAASQSTQFQCEKCNKEFRSPQGYKLHLKWHEGGKFACDKCDYITYRIDLLRKHQLIHLKIHTIKCERCEQTFKSNAAKKDHMPIHDDIDYSCKICSKYFALPVPLKNHMNNVHCAKNIKCDLCNFITASKLIFKMHTRLHVNEGNSKALKCEHCQYTTLNKRLLRSHMKVHNDELFHKCHICTFKSRYDKWLKEHIVEAHDGIKNFKCSYCDDSFITRIELELHKKRAHNYCERCSNTFINNLNFNRHLKICKLKSLREQEMLNFVKVEIKEEHGEEERVVDECEDDEVDQKIFIKEEGVSFDYS